MKNESGADFRAALEEHLRTISFKTGEAQIRLRKLAAMERFLARLADGQPASWQLKGGLALQIRSSNRFQTSEDLDMLVFIRGEQVIQFLEQAGARDVGDWFYFEIDPSDSAGSLTETGQGRLTIRVVLAGRDFETFHLDVSVGENGFWPAETFPIISLFGFADLLTTLVLCSRLAWQAAEKFYTYTHPQDHKIFSKLENLIDLLTIASLGEMDGMELYEAIGSSFRNHQAGPIPGKVAEPAASRERSFNRMAVEAGLTITDLPAAYEALKGFLEPVLSGTQAGKWDPHGWKWSTPFVTSL